MPFSLTSSFGTGSLGTGSYTHIKIIRFSADLQAGYMHFDVQFGSYSDPDWTPADNEIPIRSYKISGQDFVDLVTTCEATDAELVYDALARHLYQWLEDEGHFDGTVV